MESGKKKKKVEGKIPKKEQSEFGPYLQDPDETIGDFIREFLTTKTWSTIVMTATFFALFQVDICVMYFGKQQDMPLAYITLATFCVFATELACTLILKIDYGALPGFQKFTFYAVLDLIGTLSLIPDFVIIFGIEFGAPSNMTIARVARTARIGARLTRLMKLFRSSGGNSIYSQMAMGDEDADIQESAASGFGEAVSDGISKRVVSLTLILLITVPLFMAMPEVSKHEALEYLESLPRDKLASYFAKNEGAIRYFQEFEEGQLVYFAFKNHDCKQYTREDQIGVTCPNPADEACKPCVPFKVPRDPNDSTKPKLRPDNDLTPGCTEPPCPALEGGCNTYKPAQGMNHGVLSHRPGLHSAAESNYDLCEDHGATWHCPVACLGRDEDQQGRDGRTNSGELSVVDWRDDRKMRKNELLTYETDTLIAVFYMRNMKIAEAWTTVMYMLFNIVVFGGATGVFLNQVFDLVVNPMERMCSALQMMSSHFAMLAPPGEDGGDELHGLADGIMKLTDLLSVSLGEAGTKIITKNLQGTGEVDTMAVGEKMTGYFGFCFVNDFGFLLDALEEDVMIFTNIISDIVHKQVSSHLGNPNKNIGDSWLCVWNRSEETTFVSRQLEGEKEMTYADHAVVAFAGVIAEVANNKKLEALTSRDSFTAKYPDGYTVSMGFGLHYGWAIEGAVGSTQKMDATYLSPHVNMSARLEAATTQFNRKMLVSDVFYKHMTPEYQRWLYRVDRVVVVGASSPMVLYAYDEGPDEGNDYLHKKNRFAHEFDNAVNEYIHGNWNDAKKLLYSCLGARPGACPRFPTLSSAHARRVRAQSSSLMRCV